jgi:hypothetical protein
MNLWSQIRTELKCCIWIHSPDLKLNILRVLVYLSVISGCPMRPPSAHPPLRLLTLYTIRSENIYTVHNQIREHLEQEKAFKC